MAQFCTIITKADRVQEMEAYKAESQGRTWAIVTAEDEAGAIEAAREKFEQNILMLSSSFEDEERMRAALDCIDAYEFEDSHGVFIGWEVDSL